MIMIMIMMIMIMIMIIIIIIKVQFLERVSEQIRRILNRENIKTAYQNHQKHLVTFSRNLRNGQQKNNWKELCTKRVPERAIYIHSDILEKVN